ncbi:MAG: MATE family efflux transporter [Ruminococcaceae bacterium]|nr:MATE family efflux transporter [Oscillospiraceae bacterium]
MKLTKDFTQGNIPRQLLMFTLPFMASNALQVFYSTIDMMIVGRFVGTAGLSAVAQSSQIVNFATMVCLGVSNAGQVMVSQAIGAGKRDRLTPIIGTLFSILVILALVFSGVFLGFCTPILRLVQIPQESFEMAKEYLVICGYGMIFTAGYNMVSAVLRGMGDSKRPLLFIVIASVTNLVLDILFTGILGFGVPGAAWATVIGQAVSFLFSIYYLYRNKYEFGFDFRMESFRMEKNYARMIISLGAPMAVQSGFINLSMLFVNAIVNQVGVVASATFGVGCRIDDIVNKISQGIQYAAVPMISQNIAANQKGRAKKVVYWALVYSVVMTVFFMTLYILFGKQLFMLFSDDLQVHEMSETFIRAILWMFPAFAVMRGSGAFIQGIGHARLTMVLAMLDGVILRIGLSWLLGIGFGWGFYGFVLGYALAPYGYAVPSMVYFLSGRWEKRKTLAEEM